MTQIHEGKKKTLTISPSYDDIMTDFMIEKHQSSKQIDLLYLNKATDLLHRMI